MFNTDDPASHLERAEMHEQLAAATGDLPARKMHLAMAAEYRRKAAELDADIIRIAPPSPIDRSLKVELTVH